MRLDDLAHVVEDHFQTPGQGLLGGHHNGAAGNVLQARAIGINDPEARTLQPRVDSQYAHLNGGSGGCR